jgi:hypothetical protein
MEFFNAAINILLLLGTFAVIWFAMRTLAEGRKATAASQDMVTAAQSLLAVTRDTAESLQAAADAARRTVEAATVAHEADERHRKVRRLTEIGELVEQVLNKARTEAQRYARSDWQCAEQRVIGPLLAGAEPPLPKCRALTEASEAVKVVAAAQEARDEVDEALRQVQAGGSSRPPAPRRQTAAS